MTNCLSSSKFANLLFVNVQIEDMRATALFDTGAGMTVIAQSLLRRLRAAPEKDVLRAGNNSGVVRGLQTAVIPSIRLGDVCMENCKVLVTDDADFALSGVGSSQYKRIPYVRALRLRLQNQTIYLQNVDICDKLYGQPAEIEALLGHDFLEGRDWLLEQAFKLLS